MLVGRRLTQLEIHAFWRPCLRGMRRNLIPGLLLQALALGTVVLYHASPGFGDWLDRVGASKQRLGYLFSALGTAIFGGVIPYLVLLATGRLAKQKRWLALLFYLGFWSWKGVEVDAFYRLQALAFGSMPTFAVITKKVLIDQFVYNPLWAAPTQALSFLWKDSRYSLSAIRAQLAERPLWHRVVVILLSSWLVWIPTVAVVYSLPSVLQIPLFNLVICFWSLLLTSIAGREA
jgi:hypothetical protein